MPNEPYITPIDEEILSGYLDLLKNPYPKSHDDLVQAQEATSGNLQTIVHNLLDIPSHVQPLFPLQSLLTEPRARHLTCEQAIAASAYFRLLMLEANTFWVLVVHYIVRAYVLDTTLQLPTNRAEALTFWSIPEDPLDQKYDPDLSGHIHAHFLVAARQDPEQILEEGPDFTLRVEDGDVVLRVVLHEQPPAFIFSRTMQNPDTGEILDPDAWKKLSTKQLAKIPGLAKRFRRHHRQDIRRAHTFIWPQDFLPLMTTLDDLDNPDRHKLMDPSFQDYLARQAVLDLPQNRQGLRHIARDIRNPLPPAGPNDRHPARVGNDLSHRRLPRAQRSGLLAPGSRRPRTSTQVLKKIIDDMTDALDRVQSTSCKTKLFDTWLHYLNVYVLDAVHERPQPHLGQSDPHHPGPRQERRTGTQRLRTRPRLQ